MCGQHEKADHWSSFIHYLLKSLAFSLRNCASQKNHFEEESFDFRFYWRKCVKMTKQAENSRAN